MGRKKKSSKSLVIISGLIGIFIILIFFLEESIGAWWQFETEVFGRKVIYYLSAFGTSESDNFELLLNTLGLLAGLLFLLGAILILVSASKDSKGLAFLSSLMMIGGLFLFCYALSNVKKYEFFIDLLNFLSRSEEYNIFFGEWGIWTWRLGNGFFIAVIAAILGLIGSFKLAD